ncbi:unnamed protein product [Larinioides sclopetarius]|uniref:DUF4817 domain-containing protein n=1 Tax=Larinioides sclopetarius TaxID=280406 RepID=A0AAV1YXE5_9ARAC
MLNLFPVVFFYSRRFNTLKFKDYTIIFSVVCLMHQYSNLEKAGIQIMYGVANGNAREAVRLYRLSLLNRVLPDRRIFQRLHGQPSETGSFLGQRQDTGRPRTSRMTNRVEAILEAVDNQPERNTRTIAREQGCHHTTVWRVLREERLHPCHLQRVQALNTTDFPQRVSFARWFLEQSIL